MNFKLYKHQKKLVRKALPIMKDYGMLLLLAEERTGKTLTALKIFDKLDAQHVLFVTLKGAMASIRSDYELMDPDFKLTVINYESLHKADITGVDGVVFDESSKISAYPKMNKITRQAGDVMTKLNFPNVVLLNATQGIESYSQFYHPLKVCGKWVNYSNFYKWAEDYVSVKDKRIGGGRMVKDYSAAREKKILRYIKPVTLTLTREDAGFSQTDAEITVHKVSIPREVLTLYKDLEKDLVITLPNGTEVVAETAPALLTKLQQISGGFIYDEDLVAHPLHSAKIDWLLDNIEGDKIAIYAKFRWEVEALTKAFDATNDHDAFKHDRTRVLVKQVKSGAKGIDLSFCDNHYFYSLDFSGEAFVQGIIRQANMRREEKIHAHIILTDNLIDNYVFEAVSQKKKFNTKLYKALR